MIRRKAAAATALLAAAGLAALTGCGSSHGGSSGPGHPSAHGSAASGSRDGAPTGQTDRTDRAKGRPKLAVSDAYIPAPASPDVAAGYLTIRNTGTSGDRLVKVVSRLARDVSLHRTTSTEMKQVSGFDIPAGATLRLGPAGNHLMLMDLKSKPRPGDTDTFELHFSRSAPITVKVPVKPLTYRRPGGE